jgi:hypothetical protein
MFEKWKTNGGIIESKAKSCRTDDFSHFYFVDIFPTENLLFVKPVLIGCSYQTTPFCGQNVDASFTGLLPHGKVMEQYFQ